MHEFNEQLTRIMPHTIVKFAAPEGRYSGLCFKRQLSKSPANFVLRVVRRS